ncbi:MAG: iron chelate uptake ABC transporter family permease subunit, partial [Chloroflexota bacterium]
RRTLPITALKGALFVLQSDIIGRRVIYTYEIPIGMVIGVIGSIVFLVMIFQSQQQGRGYATG